VRGLVEQQYAARRVSQSGAVTAVAPFGDHHGHLPKGKAARRPITVTAVAVAGLR